MNSTGAKEVSVTPWPFNKLKFTVSYESRTLSKLIFTSPENFRKEVLLVKVNVETLVFVSSPR